MVHDKNLLNNQQTTYLVEQIFFLEFYLDIKGTFFIVDPIYVIVQTIMIC